MKMRNYLWGVGGVADNLLTYGLAWTIIPVFNIGYGVDAFWLGVFIFVPRILDVITDPLMGILSDRTRGRFGRRRPYIFAGAITMALLFALLWLPPFGKVEAVNAVATSTGTTSGWFGLPPLPTGNELMLLMWIGLIYSLITLAYTVFSVPYIAMGYEFTRNYDKMTKIMASRLYFTTFAGFGVVWLYSFSVHDAFGGDETVGMRYVGGAVAIIAALSGIVPALFCTEDLHVDKPKEKVSIKEIISATFGNKAFVYVMTAMLVFAIAIYTTGALTMHINVFYIAEGDKAFGAKLVAISGNIITICSLCGMYVMIRLSRLMNKRSVALMCLAILFVGFGSHWWTWNRDYPYLQYISAVLVGIGSSGIWLMIDSMIGDVTKDEEARTGIAREGIYGASKSCLFKVAVALTSLSGAFVLSMSGYDEQAYPTEDVQLNLRLLFLGFLCGGIIIAFIALWLFPISREKAEENERIIRERLTVNHDNNKQELPA
ncbi:MFS transporter [Poriferisphaera sp. WC338]|uniref:MFS transporter n=1 Tax=Poriferisphaera sp. WC338 TaxID=3425129 RepID=UPI003D8132E8